MNFRLLKQHLESWKAEKYMKTGAKNCFIMFKIEFDLNQIFLWCLESTSYITGCQGPSLVASPPCDKQKLPHLFPNCTSQRMVLPPLRTSVLKQCLSDNPGSIAQGQYSAVFFTRSPNTCGVSALLCSGVKKGPGFSP